jgi:hypothetical protein
MTKLLTGNVPYIQILLGQMRKEYSYSVSENITKFLEAVKNIPDDAIVVLEPGKASLLVDDEGYLLTYF